MDATKTKKKISNSRMSPKMFPISPTLGYLGLFGLIIFRGGGTCQKLGAQITLKPKKWMRKTFIFIS